MDGSEERTRRRALRTLGASLSSVVLAIGAGLTMAGGNGDRQENNESAAASRKGPLYVHGPTTRYQQIEDSPPGIFGGLENRSERTVWMARLEVKFYAEDGRHVGTRAQHFLRVRPGESREIALPFTNESFNDRSVTLTSGVLDTILTGGRTISGRTNPKNGR